MSEQQQLQWQRTNLENIEQAWEGDLWDRERLGVQLTNYVDRLNCGAVLALDARWGEGKTWFVRHWKKHLEDENHNVIYLDAFANDYLEDPFLVISSEITGCLSQDTDVDQSHINNFKEKAAAAYQALLPSLPKVLLTLGLNLISGGVFGALAQQVHESGEKVIESATDTLGEKIQESIEVKIENHEADKNTLLSFKNELAKLADELEKPLVFIIDELDRCRPDFAIRLIERIKHFFDIPKIVFVLVMDKAQFSKVVCHNYGYDEKLGEEYLDKFIDFLIPLSPVSGLYSNNESSYSIVKKLFYDVGEESEEIILIFYISLRLKYLSPRIIKKKINHYALLKTIDTQKNMFLILAIITDPINLIDKFEVLTSIIYGLQFNNDSIVFQTLTHRQLKDIKKFLKLTFEIEAREFVDLLEQIIDIYKKYPISSNILENESLVHDLTNLYSSYALKPLEHFQDISLQLEQYLNSNLS